jgi:hypothetical protein
MINDLSNQKFNRLTAHWPVGHSSGRSTLWLCSCDCGSLHIVKSSALRTGSSKSCGCLQREIAARIGDRARTHGHTEGKVASSTYNSWYGMLQRCKNQGKANYAYYGGRGITVCERWNRFENFLADMGEKPTGLTIERRNNDGHYEPSNCYWATMKEQCRTRRKRTDVQYRNALGRYV